MNEYHARIASGKSLGEDESFELFEGMLGASLPPQEIARILVALFEKGETAEEIAGCVKSMMSRAVRVALPGADGAVDNCGTGGDSFKTANISTPAAIIAAACGCRLAKHGNRAVTGRCGSVDLLEALGVPVSKDPQHAIESFSKSGACFLFAPAFHPCMGRLMPIRKSIAQPTIFNIVGPLCNPASAGRQLIGARTPKIARKIADAIALLGRGKALVVCGETPAGYIDEISPCSKTVAFIVGGNSVEETSMTIEDFGTLPVDADLVVQAPDSAVAADEVAGAFRMEKSGRLEALRAAYAMNASATLYAAGRVGGFEEGFEAAMDAMQSGLAQRKLATLAGGD